VTSMHLLLSDAERNPRPVLSTVVSAGLHAGLLVVLALSGERVANAVGSLIEQTVQYLYPAPREIGLPRPGLLVDPLGAAAREVGPGAPRPANGAGTDAMTARSARTGIEFAPIPLDGESLEPGVGDNAFSTVEVDSVALFDPTSAAPEYPEHLATRRVEGGATLRFVVDSTGLIDMSTVRVMTSTHKAFAQSVVEAMPRMKYRPARVGERAVRLLVEQSFSFKIQKPKGQIS
jgi:TonB family protein